MSAGSCGFTSVVFATMVVFGLLSGVAVLSMPAAATTNATIDAAPNDVGATSTHRATATVGSCEAGDSLNKLRVDYTVGSDPADVSNVDARDVQTVGIDTDGDGTIDKDVSADLSSVGASNNGHTLNVGFGGSYSLYDGDTVIIEFADVTNPSTAGTFDVNVSVNYQSDPVCPSTTSLTIEQTAADASLSADPSTAGSVATHTANRTVGSTNQGTTLSEFTVKYAASNASGLSASDVTTAGLDTDSDDAIETDLLGDLSGVTVSNGGATVTFSFGGSHTLDSGDRLVLAYEGVTNPSTSGDYTVDTVLNGTTTSATLSISSGSDPSATISADPSTADASATHIATIGVDSSDVGDSLNKLRVDYTVGSAPADVSSVGADDIQAVGIDTDGDGTIDTDVSSDLSSVSASNDGHTLDVGFGGSYSLSDGDTVVIEFADVTNPNSSGTFDVNVSLNYQSDPVTRATASLSITENQTSDDTTSDNTTSDGTQQSDNQTTESVTLDVDSASISADPSTAAVGDATHTIRATVATGGPTATLEAITVDYTLGVDPADVGDFARDHIQLVGVDTDGDSRVDRRLSGSVTSVSTSNAGETASVSFDGSAEIDDGETLVLRYEDVQNPAGEGNYDVGITVNAAGQQTATVASLMIDGGSTSSEDSAETAVAVSVNGSSVTAVIQNARAGDPVSVETDSAPAKRGATFAGIDLTFAEQTSTTLQVDGALSRPVDVTGADLDHFAIHHGEINVSHAAIRFYVANETLSSRGVAPEDVVLVRRHDGQWQELDTRIIGSTAGATLFVATAPGLSTFAVSARPLTRSQEPIFRVENTELSIDSVDAGKRARVTATIRNVGTANGTFDAQLTANGVILTNQSLTLDAGESKRVRFVYNFSEPAVYDVAISGADAGAIEVDAAPSPTPNHPSAPTRSSIPPGLLGLLAVVSLASVAVWVSKLW